MSTEIPIAAAVLFTLSGFMQRRISRYFDGGEYDRERLVTKYGSWVCFACAILFVAINIFV